MLVKTANLIDKLVVNPGRMLENLNLTRGLVFSGELLLELTAAGASREEAYTLVQRNAMRAWDEGLDFRELVSADAEISRLLTPSQIAKAFDVRSTLKNVDRIFERVFERSK
jgi:adenylosuccinate lyase